MILSSCHCRVTPLFQALAMALGAAFPTAPQRAHALPLLQSTRMFAIFDSMCKSLSLSCIRTGPTEAQRLLCVRIERAPSEHIGSGFLFRNSIGLWPIGLHRSQLSLCDSLGLCKHGYDHCSVLTALQWMWKHP